MAEYAPDKRRGLYGSFLEFGTLGGFALGTAVVLVLQVVLGEAAMEDWGWRIPFFVAGPLGAIGLYLRSQLDETPVFADLEESGQSEPSATHGLRASWSSTGSPCSRWPAWSSRSTSSTTPC